MPYAPQRVKGLDDGDDDGSQNKVITSITTTDRLVSVTGTEKHQ
jgi:hypothetical protein